jgi:hypothetical protein
MLIDLIVVTIGSKNLLKIAVHVHSLTTPLVIGLMEGSVVTLMEGLVVGQRPFYTFVE